MSCPLPDAKAGISAIPPLETTSSTLLTKRPSSSSLLGWVRPPYVPSMQSISQSTGIARGAFGLSLVSRSPVQRMVACGVLISIIAAPGICPAGCSLQFQSPTVNHSPNWWGIHESRATSMSLLSQASGYPSMSETLYVSDHIISETAAVRCVPWRRVP